ncbi:MAG: hypothetical protein ACP6IY_14505 [Promethearchaeia archaeon]
MMIGIADLKFEEILQGFLSLMFVVISIVLGLKIILKYFEFKKRELFLVGLSWIGMSFPWLGDAINIILILIIKQTLPSIFSLTIYSFLPLFLICWLIAFTDLVIKQYQKIIIGFAIIFSIIFEIVFYSLLLKDEKLIGEYRKGPFQITWNIFMSLFLIIFIIILIITGVLFALKSMSSSYPEVRLKGRFILIAFISFTTGAVIEALFVLEPVIVVFTRTILTLSAIEFYLGFILPDKVKKLFLKE